MKALFSRIRTLLVLGRVSNLPTVWSNILTGAFLAGADINPYALVPLLTAASFLYVGGMYLNDYCDAAFDASYCPERPIPAGKLSRRSVGVLAVVWFALGLAGLSRFDVLTFGIGIALTAAIVLYDFWHKNNSVSPLIMGICRMLLYPLAGSIALDGMSWHVFLWAAAVGLYVAGISYLARGESRPGRPTRWALLLLVLPVLLAGWFAFYYSLYSILGFGVIFLAWLAWLLIPLWRGTNRSIVRGVSGLLAGIILADVVVLAPVLLGAPAWGLIYLALFLIALLLQRIIPAT